MSDTKGNRTNASGKASSKGSSQKLSPYSSSSGPKTSSGAKVSSVSKSSPNKKTIDKSKVQKDISHKKGIGDPTLKKKVEAVKSEEMEVKQKHTVTETYKFKKPVIKNGSPQDSSKQTSRIESKTKVKKDTLPLKAQVSRHALKNIRKEEVLPSKESSPSSKSVSKSRSTHERLSQHKGISKNVSGIKGESKKDEANKISSSKKEGKGADVGRLGHQRTRTRTLSPRESKLLSIQVEQEEKKKQVERDARILRKSPIPSTSKDVSIVHVPDEPEPDDYEYEDDFEDYESDFEDDIESDISDDEDNASGKTYSITDDENDSDTETRSDALVELTAGSKLQKEEEKKLDSGNYDLADRRRKSKELQEIKLSIERENSAVLTAKQRQQFVAADEGFVEGKVEDAKVVSTPTRTNFINFANARKRQLEKKATAKVKKRGDELFSMIKLDVMSYYLFDIAPIPYEVYMKSYGRSNTVQAQVQTNEDNLSAEIQTEEIYTKNKWTQKPVSFCTKIIDVNSKNDNAFHFSKEYLGVGGDIEEDPDEWKERIKINSIRLNQFLSSAGQAILAMLEEDDAFNHNTLKGSVDTAKFSDGYVDLSTKSVPFLKGCPVVSVCFPLHVPNLLLTVHQDVNQNIEETRLIKGTVLCVWNIFEPSRPQKVLMVSQRVTSTCFEPIKANLVFAGLYDGSVCLWDLREHSSCHTKITVDESELVLRSPTYTTAKILKDSGHMGPVVTIKPVMDNNTHTDDENRLLATQMCSLDENGTAIIWTVIQSYSEASRSGIFNEDMGVAYWGRVRLSQSAVINVQDTVSKFDQSLNSDLQFSDMAVDGDHLYITTNTGYVIHCLKSEGKAIPKVYSPKSDGIAFTTCIEMCPFALPFFLVGCSDGTVRLHSKNSDKPLTIFAGTGDPIGQGPQILSLQWSRCRPFVFFVLDSLSRIHVWDISAGDIFPQCTVSLTDKVRDIQVSPVFGREKEPAHMVIATSSGKVELHLLKDVLVRPSPSRETSEVEMFLDYISHL